MEPQYELESLRVADAISGMTDDEVRTLVDEVYASGLVKTLQDVTLVLSTVDEQATLQAQQLPMFA